MPKARVSMNLEKSYPLILQITQKSSMKRRSMSRTF
jgi:hypothetical protein